MTWLESEGQRSRSQQAIEVWSQVVEVCLPGVCVDLSYMLSCVRVIASSNWMTCQYHPTHPTSVCHSKDQTRPEVARQCFDMNFIETCRSSSSCDMAAVDADVDLAAEFDWQLCVSQFVTNSLHCDDVSCMLERLRWRLTWHVVTLSLVCLCVCVSLVTTWRCASMCCDRLSVCLSVCLSHAGIVPKRLIARSHKQWPGTLVFWPQRSRRNSDMIIPTGSGRLK